MKNYKLLLSTGLLVCWGTASADTTIIMRDGNKTAAESTTFYITEDHVRIDHDKGGDYGLFDPATDTLIAVNPAKESYMVIDRARFASMMKEARARMEQILADLPPAQRERMRKMMGKHFGIEMGDESKMEPEVARTGNEKTVAGYSCEVVKLHIGTRANGTACLASRSDLGIPEADYQSLHDFMVFYKPITEQLAGQFASVSLLTKVLDLGGFPVAIHIESHSRHGGGANSKLASVEVGPLSADLFTIPEGYEQRAMPTIPTH